MGPVIIAIRLIVRIRVARSASMTSFSKYVWISFAQSALVAAALTSSAAHADRASDDRLYAQEFTDARQVFWDCMQGVNSKPEYTAILSKTIPIDQSTKIEREASGEAKFRDRRFFSEQEIAAVLGYEAEFQKCIEPFGLNRPDKRVTRNGFNSLTLRHFNWLKKSTAQLTEQAQAITIGEYNRYRHYHYSVWQSEMARLFRIVNEQPAVETDPLTYGAFLQHVLASESVSYVNTSGVRYLKFEAEQALTVAGALGAENSPKGIKMKMHQSIPIVAGEVEHEIWLSPGYSSGRVTSVRPYEREDPTTKGWVSVIEGNEMILGSNNGSRAYDLDRRERLVLTKDKIDLFQEVFIQGDWSVLGQDTYWLLSDEEIDRLGNRYPPEFGR